MLVRACILIALASIVKASVIVNVFEDGEMKASHSLHDCNPTRCNRFCRSAGFKEGSCVGNRCRCTSYSDLTDNKADHSVHGSCNFQACDQLCRRLGFPGGACVGDKCDCDNFEPHDIAENKAHHSVHDSCNFQACNQICRILGFPGGACVGDKCDCDNFEPIGIKGKALDYLLRRYREKKASHSLKECYNIECDAICRIAGHPGGYCKDSRCYCNIGTNLYTENTETSDSDEDTNIVMS